MLMLWLAKNGVQQGPMPLAQAQKLIDEGHYQSHHMAWVVGTPTWGTIAEVPELSQGFRPPGTPLGADYPNATAAPPPPPAARVPLAGHIKPHSRAPKPWRRFAARALDTALVSYLLEMVFGHLLPLGGGFASFLLTAPSAVLLVPIEMLGIQYFQTTPGKALFGIIVHSDKGTALTRPQSLERAIRACVFGGAFGIPIVSSVASFIAYLDIRRPESATWDRATHAVVFYEDNTMLRQLAGTLLLMWLDFAGMWHTVFG